MPLEGTQLGHYRLLRLIGSGGMGEVYCAEDIRIARQVAIKVIRIEETPSTDAETIQETTRLFQREMRAITLLDHPHILPLYDFGEETFNKATLAYMVMPFRAEGSLADWLRERSKEEPLALQDIAYILTQAADALQHAHDNQLVHQDVKPSNFLIRRRAGSADRPELFLSDFGIAKFTSSMATSSQNVRGTPAFMAPEQWDGMPVAASDQYALAIMAYQLLTGRIPFTGRMEQVMRQHFNTIPQPPSSLQKRIPPAIDAIILRALSKKSEERYPRIADFAYAFEQAVQSSNGSGDLRATLAISQDEATTGTVRTLTLPGGRRVSISIPANAQDGQTIRLDGQGEATYPGGPRGLLILSLAVTQQQRSAPNTDNEINNPTALISNTNPPSSGPPSLIPPPPPLHSNSFYSSHTSNTPPPHPQGAPVQIPDATIPSSGSIPRPFAAPSAPSGRKLSLRTLLLAGLALALILLGIFGFTSYQGYIQRQNAQATVTARTATVGATSTAGARLNASATAIFVNATATKATATAQAIASNPYPSYFPGSGTLALYDPLQDNSVGNAWKEGDNCDFKENAYHATEPKSDFFTTCYAQFSTFDNFTFEVQMKIITGNCGGMVVRGDADKHTFYFFQICTDGYYTLYLYKGSGDNSTLLKSNTNAPVHAGLNQTNLIAMRASGSTIEIYVNQKKVDSVTDGTYKSGQIGVISYPRNAATEVAYSNARVWAL